MDGVVRLNLFITCNIISVNFRQQLAEYNIAL